MTSATDLIEKHVLLRAPRARVWRALTDPEEFGSWFRVKLEGPFVVGALTRGRITYPGYEHLVLEMQITRMEPVKLFAYRWHPYAVDSKADYSQEACTLVEFHLEDAEGGTRLCVVESGFDALPPERREEAFRMNQDGWTIQLQNVAAHVAPQ